MNTKITRGLFACVGVLLACLPVHTAHAAFKADLGFQAEHYFAEEGVGQNQVKWFTLFDARTDGLWQSESLEARILTDLTLPPRDPSFFVVTPKENYVSIGRSSDSAQLSIGQKQVPFSEMDRRWELGLWAPRKRIDPLRSEPMGLLGVFTEARSGVFRFSGYVSPLSLPETGVPSEVKDGNFVSPYPMFSAPSSEIELFNVPTPVRYTIEQPNTWSFLQRWNGGATLLAGNDSSGFFGRGSYAYQTIPQILVGFTGGLGQGGPLREARVTLHPRRADHHLFGFEGGYAGERGRLIGSAAFERVIRDETPVSWNTQEIADQTKYFSLAQDLRLWGENAEAGMAELMMFRRLGEDAQDRGPLLTGAGNLFDPRSPYSTAISARLHYGIPGMGDRFHFEHRWVRDLTGLSDMWSSQGTYRATAQIRIVAGFDFLRTLRPDRTEDLISIYRAQDRMYGGVRYAF